MKPLNSLRPVVTALVTFLFFVACATSAAVAPAATIVIPVATTQLPTPPPLPPPSSRVPGQVTGSVLLEQGRQASGGVADTTIQVEVDLSATSSAGKVTAMRIASVPGCDNSQKVEQAQWQPFASKTTLPAALGLNWIGFYAAAQFRDDQGNLSPVYCDDISLEGSPPIPAVNPTDWYPQIRCFAESDVHPSQGEIVSGLAVTFTWPGTNQLPDGVFYQVNAYSAVDQYTGLAAQGRTRQSSLALPIPSDKAGDIVWYLVLVDANGAFLDHGRCSSFAASLLTVNPPTGIKGVHFLYRP